MRLKHDQKISNIDEPSKITYLRNDQGKNHNCCWSCSRCYCIGSVLIGFIGQGNVREVPLYYQEKVEQTVVFEEVDGQVRIVGIKGVKGEVNPTLLTRTSFAYILTVINNGTTQH